MVNIKLIINNKVYYAMCSDESNRQKMKMGITWADLLHHLESGPFLQEDEINQNSENNHLIDLSESLDGLKFLIFTFRSGEKNMFSVHCNEKVLSSIKMPFNKWRVNLACGHSFLMDSSVDSQNKYKRVFCSNCLEKSYD